MQKQKNKITIQGEIENALKKLNLPPQIDHAGRTDRGVHALNQVISFEVKDFWDINKLQTSLNNILHPHIHIKKISFTSKDFNPRFDAKKRSYRYILTNQFSPFLANYTTYYPKEINLKLLQKAIKEFEGVHDFEYFAKTGSSVKSFVREIYKTNVFEYKNFTIFTFQANGFLRSQIRIMVDFLLQINENSLTIEDLKAQLNKKELLSKHLAPPNGLYLERIWY